MARYYVNNEARPEEDNEVHVETCPRLELNSLFLGEYRSCDEAVMAAKRFHVRANGCELCSQPCRVG